jgi:hypothetical protein
VTTSALRHSSAHFGISLSNFSLLAPANWYKQHRFRRLTIDPVSHLKIFKAMQRFRGASYLADGALRPHNLTADGRHCQPVDADSWHLLVHDDYGSLVSCARYYPIPDPQFEATAAAKTALANAPHWRTKVRGAVEASIRRARERGANFAELGGWCVARSSRFTSHALRSVLCMYALGEVLGGTIGFSTATTRHSSSSILQRLGAQKADWNGECLPSYFDPFFDCDMELLQFDSLRPSPRYADQVSQYIAEMRAEMPVICRSGSPPTCVKSINALWKAVSLETGDDQSHFPVRTANAQPGVQL